MTKPHKASLIASLIAVTALISGCAEEQSSAASKEPAASARNTERKVEKPASSEQATETGENIVTSRGKFSGRNGHETSGIVEVIRTPSGYQLKLTDDFNFDGAPDPTLAFGNGAYVAASNFSKLRKNKGGQTYDLPKTMDPAIYTQVYVYCKEFSVTLGVAELEIIEDLEGLDDTFGS